MLDVKLLNPVHQHSVAQAAYMKYDLHYILSGRSKTV